MKNTILSAATLLALSILTACQQGPDVAEKFTVKAVLSDAPAGSLVKLVQLPFSEQNPVIIDSARTDKNGLATLEGSAKEASLFRIDLDGGTMPLGMMIVNDGSDIQVRLNKDNYRKPEVKGSDATTALYNLFEDYAQQDSLIRQNLVRISELPATPQGDSMRNVLQKKNQDLIDGTKKLVADFAETEDNPVLDFYALMMGRQLMDGKDWNRMASTFVKQHPKHSSVAQVEQMITANNARPDAQPEKYALLGQQAPELNLPDANGNLVQLSSYKGRYLLIDFWASWCGPCRAENPNVVAAYKQFGTKNFAILGVSLDKEWKNWQNAVKSDSLKWTQVSDLKEWNSSAVQLYQFQSIPFNVLLDPDGKVIASDLRGPALQEKLRELVK